MQVVLLPPHLHLSPPLLGAGFPSEQTPLCPGDPSLQADGGEVGIGAFGGWGSGIQALNPADFSRYYADIHQSSPASYQEMNSALAELSGVRLGSGDLVLHI